MLGWSVHGLVWSVRGPALSVRARFCGPLFRDVAPLCDGPWRRFRGVRLLDDVRL